VIMATIYRKYSPRKDLTHKIRYRKIYFVVFVLQSHFSLHRIGADPCLPLDDIMMYFDPIDEEGSSSSSTGWSPAKPKRKKEKQKEEPKDVIEKVGF